MSIQEGTTIIGDETDEALDGTLGNDHIFGCGGNDIIRGNGGTDILFGQAGDDIYYVDSTDDWITELADEGRDRVYSLATFQLSSYVEELVLIGAANINGYGNNGHNLLVGNIANNVLKGFGGDDRIWGGLGDDILDGGAASDYLVGGKGNDVYYVDSHADTVVELTGEGQDRIYASATFNLLANVEELVLIGAGNIDATGDEIHNLLVGNISDNVLKGMAGNDQLFGGLGNDILDGGYGFDKLVGGAGDDIYYVGQTPTAPTASNDIDTVEELAGGGRDTIHATGLPSYTLPDHVEDGVLLTLRGPHRYRHLYGNASDNVLRNEVGDEISGFTASQHLSGEDGDDILYGGRSKNWLDGGEGDDILYAGSGINALYGGPGHDILYAGGAQTSFGGHEESNDHFIFPDISSANETEVRYFTSGYTGVLDLSLIDASILASGNNAFTLTDAFTGKAGELVIRVSSVDIYDGRLNYHIEGDVDGDAVPDLSLWLPRSTVSASDVIL